jgi:ketosteroid isomerase-like protein
VSSENLELVRSIHAAWERGDFSSADWADPEIEFVIAEGVNAGSWRGLGAMAKAWRDYLVAWEDWRLEVDEYRELDDERVLVLARRRGRGKLSGLELGQLADRATSVMHVRAGKVTKLVIYADRERALAHLGLASDTDVDSAS